MSDFVNIFVSGTDSGGKDLSVQGFFKKTLVYIDGICYTELEAKLAMCEVALRAAHLPLPPYDVLLETDDA